MRADVGEPGGPSRRFPSGFLWGVATSAYQIEGSTTADGRTDSIWDVLCRRPGAILGGQTGEPAADHYRRMPEDVALMAGLGLAAYRFSVAWPRVHPNGGPVNQRGLDFYRRLTDELLARGIAPWVTLYHWDLPQTLEDRGGWASRDTAHRFAEYADTVHEALADRVPYWTTLNEPWCAAYLGYASGEHAPGRTEPRAAVAAMHHLLLGHGLAAAAIRARDPAGTLGITLNLATVDPADPAEQADVDAARRIDGMQNRVFLDALLKGGYPPDVLADLEPYRLTEHVHEGDLTTISAPLDLLGVNYYTGFVVGGAPGETPGRAAPYVGSEHVSFRDRGRPVTAMGWEVYPEGMAEILRRLSTDYPASQLYVTENGAAYPDMPADGLVDDPDRIEYLAAHVQAVHDAIEAGVDVRGYFVWSLLDNFEWSFGYSRRFGLVYVDYGTQQRIRKSSFHWYASTIAANAAR